MTLWRRSTTARSPTSPARSTPTCARSRPRSTSTITHRGGAFTLSGESAQAARAAEALERFYAAAEKPLSVDDIQLGLVEIATQAGAAAPAKDEVADDGGMPLLRTRRTDLHGRTPNQVAYLQRHHDPRHHVRHRPGGHRQDVPRGGLRRRRARARRGEAHRARAPRGGSGRAPGLPARATSRRRSTRTCVRSTTRCTTSWASTRWASSSSARPSRWRRSPTCAGARSTTRSSSSTRRRTPRPSR